MSTKAKVRAKVLADGGTFEEGYTGFHGNDYWVEVALPSSELVWHSDYLGNDCRWYLRVEQEPRESRADLWKYIWDTVQHPVVKEADLP
jgi:hypothetical protein